VPLDRTPDAWPDGLRRVTDADADGLIALIGAAYDEHPGCVLDLPGLDDDLPIPGTTAARRGSPWWVVGRDGEVVATIGAGRLDAAGRVELKRLYVRRDHRGEGLATALIGLVERQAAGVGASEVELWTDTRFADAHRRYEALGYVPTGETRPLHDPSDTTEYRYLKPVTPTAPVARVPWDAGHDGPREVSVTALPDGWSLVAAAARPGGTGATAGGPFRIEVDAGWRLLRVEQGVGEEHILFTSDGAARWWRDGEAAPELSDLDDVDAAVAALGGPPSIGRLVAACRHAAGAAP
jgi:putative acetyltransferase